MTDRFNNSLSALSALCNSLTKTDVRFSLPEGFPISVTPIFSALGNVMQSLPEGFTFDLLPQFADVANELAESLGKVMRARAPWLKCEFHQGFRRVPLNEYEWDFRCVESECEATHAWTYEYSRDVEWLYRFDSWDTDPERETRYDGKEYYESWLVCHLPAYWPVPWRLLFRDALRPFEPRALGPAVRPLNAARLVEMLKDGMPGNVAALQIDWQRGFEAVCADLKEWVRKAAPPDAIGAKRGKRVKSENLLKLRWLAAHRLSRGGLSYTKANNLLRDARKRGGDPDARLPIYQSAGGWNDAVKKAESLFREHFSEPSQGSESQLAK